MQQLFFQFLLKGLKTDTLYELKLRAATRSSYDAGRLYAGETGQPHKILLRGDCQQVQFSSVRSSSAASAAAAAAAGTNDGGGVSGFDDESGDLDLGAAGAVAGIACVVFAVLCALVGLAMWR